MRGVFLILLLSNGIFWEAMGTPTDQEGAPDEGSSTVGVLEPSAYDALPELAPVEATAWHFDADILDVPADVILIDREAIENSMASNVPELLRSEANVLFRSNTGMSNEGELAMRGFGENSGLRVLVLVDGQKMNRPDMGAMEWQALPLGEIESVEVIRGGQNVLYGNHALAGVIKIKTRKGGPARFEAKAHAGSFGSEQLAAMFTAGRDGFYYRLSSNHLHTDGFREHSRSHSANIAADLGYFLTDNDELLFKASYSEGFIQFPGPLTYAEAQANPRQSTNGGNQQSESANTRYTLTYNGARSWGEMEAHLGYNDRDLRWNLDGIFADNRQQGLSFAPRVKVGEGRDFFIFGGDAFVDQLDFLNYKRADRQIVQAQADLQRLTTGAYLFGQKELGEVLLSAGTRYERAQTDFLYEKYNPNQLEPFLPIIFPPFIVPNPDYKNPPDLVAADSYNESLTKSGWAAEVSANWQPAEAWSLWVGYDRVYRYPVLDETAAYQGFALAEPLNRELDPEEGNNFEAGLKYSQDSWKATVTLFHLRMDNEIVFDEVNNLNVNLGATERFGANLSLNYEKERWGAGTLWTFVDARLKTTANNGKRAPLVPKAHAVSNFWIRPVENLRLSLSHSFVSERFQGNDYANMQRTLASYHLFDAQADFALTEQLSTFVRVSNLFDHAYSATAYNGGYYPGASRSFHVGGRVHF